MFAQAFGIKAVAVPFRSNNEALSAVMAGDVQFLLLSRFFALPQYKAGNIGVLANMGTERSPYLPGVSAISELGHPDLVVEAQNGFVEATLTTSSALPRDSAMLRVSGGASLALKS